MLTICMIITICILLNTFSADFIVCRLRICIAGHIMFLCPYVLWSLSWFNLSQILIWVAHYRWAWLRSGCIYIQYRSGRGDCPWLRRKWCLRLNPTPCAIHNVSRWPNMNRETLLTPASLKLRSKLSTTHNMGRHHHILRWGNWGWIRTVNNWALKKLHVSLLHSMHGSYHSWLRTQRWRLPNWVRIICYLRGICTHRWSC